MTAIIGLDHGTRRIGVAVAETETGLAFSRPAIRRRSLEADLGTIRGLAADESARIIIIGLPLNMDGTEGSQAGAVRAFGDRLVAIGMTVAYQDERLSSWEAGQRLAGAGERPSRQSGEIDSAAARLILQQYLDAHPPEETE